MMYGIKVVLRYWLGIDTADRNLAVYPDDTLIPDTSSQSNRTLKRTPRPRFIKSHQYFDPRYPRVLYVVRDPRDLVLSYYDFQRKYRQIADDYPLANYVDDFVEGRLISSDWGTWGENVASWISTRQNRSSFLLLRYEDMKKDTERELRRIAAFLGLAAEPERLQRAISASSLDRMRELERSQSGQWVATRKHRDDIPFVGPARAGRWQTELPQALVGKIESAWGKLMVSLGYSLHSTSVSGTPADGETHQLQTSSS